MLSGSGLTSASCAMTRLAFIYELPRSDRAMCCRICPYPPKRSPHWNWSRVWSDRQREGERGTKKWIESSKKGDKPIVVWRSQCQMRAPVEHRPTNQSLPQQKNSHSQRTPVRTVQWAICIARPGLSGDADPLARAVLQSKQGPSTALRLIIVILFTLDSWCMALFVGWHYNSPYPWWEIVN